MTESIIRAPRFDFGAAVTQIFNLPGGKSYLFRVLGFGSLLMIAALLLLGVPIVKAYIAMFSGMMDADLSGMSEAEEMAAVMSSMQPLFASMGLFTLLYIFQIGIFIAVETALYRNIIRGEDKGLFPLRFGMDEFKVLIARIVVAFILYAVFFAAYIGVIIIGALLFGIGGAADSGVLIAIMGLLGVLLFFVLVGAMIYGAVRLAPSAAFAVRDEDFTPVGSWGTMKSYFWPTLGAVLVVGLIGYIGLMVVSLLAFGFLFSASGIFPILMSMDANANEVPDFAPMFDALTSAGFIIPAVIIGLITTFLSFLYMGAIWSIWGYVAKLTARGNAQESVSPLH